MFSKLFKISFLITTILASHFSYSQTSPKEIREIRKKNINNEAFSFDRTQDIKITSTVWEKGQEKDKILLKRLFPKVHEFLEAYTALEISIKTTGIKRKNQLTETVVDSKIKGLKSPKLISLIFQSNYSDYNYKIIKISGQRFYNPLYYPRKYNFTKNITQGLISYTFKPKKVNKYLVKGYFYTNEKGQIDYFKLEPSKFYNSYESSLSFENIVTDSLTYPKVAKSTAEIDPKSKRLGSLDLESISKIENHKPSNRKLITNNIVLDFDKIENTDSTYNSNQVDNTLKYIEALRYGRLGIGKIDFLLKHIVSFNSVEGLRFGLGVATNNKLSKHFDLGGYFAYGSKDYESKFGIFSNLNLHKKSNSKLFINYSNDLMEPGQTYFPYSRRIFLNEGFRKFGILQMDRVSRFESKIKTTLRKNIFIESGFTNKHHSPLYNYEFLNSNNEISKVFNSNEINFGIRYNPSEKFFKLNNRLYSLGSKYPSIYINYSKSINLTGYRYYDYNRIDFKVEKHLNLMQYGKVDFQVISGFLNNTKLPYPFIYNMKGSFRPGTPIINNTFGTMNYNEFLASKYTALFYLHNVGKIANQKTFKPELLLIHNMGIGNAIDLTIHNNLTATSMNKGYFESGFYFKNLISFQHLIGQTGFGMGFLYRYGYYAHPDGMDNLVFKFSLDFDI